MKLFLIASGVALWILLIGGFLSVLITWVEIKMGRK